LGDISKMYHSIDIPLQDQMTHLFLWRNLKTDTPPSTYAMTAVNMGDKPSATIAQISLRKSAAEFADLHPEAAKVITDDSYMDDIASSTCSLGESKDLTDQIDTILSQRGFSIKEWIFAGAEKPAVSILSETQEGEIQKGRVLGIQ